MAIRSVRILCRLDFPSGTIRLWDGSGPHLDGNGDIWDGAGELIGLDQLELALNGEAVTMSLGLSAPSPQLTDLAWQADAEGDVVGAGVQILIQPCDEVDQPVGDAQVRFTGTIDDIQFDEAPAAGDEGGIVSTVTVSVVNRFTLRNLVNGSVLSDVDQKARSKLINPSGTPDRICERVPLLLDKTIVWPRFTT